MDKIEDFFETAKSLNMASIRTHGLSVSRPLVKIRKNPNQCITYHIVMFGFVCYFI